MCSSYRKENIYSKDMLSKCFIFLPQSLYSKVAIWAYKWTKSHSINWAIWSSYTKSEKNVPSQKQVYVVGAYDNTSSFVHQCVAQTIVITVYYFDIEGDFLPIWKRLPSIYFALSIKQYSSSIQKWQAFPSVLVCTRFAQTVLNDVA